MAWTKNGKKIGNKWNYKKGKKVARKTPRYEGPRVFRPQSFLRTAFPKTTAVTMKYVEGFSLDPAAFSSAYYVFRANSVYDPNYTSTGGQPLGYDQWTPFYTRYVVVAARIKFTVHANDSTGSQGAIGLVHVMSAPSPFTVNMATLMEQPTARYTMGNHASALGSGKGIVVRHSFDARKFFNVSDVVDNTSTIGATVTSDPQEDVYFGCFLAGNPVATTGISKHYCIVEIEYDTIFSDPKELNAS